MLYNSLHNRALRLVVAVIGELIAAAALNLFIVPLHLYTGGLMGVCQLLRTLASDYLGMSFGAYDVAGILYFLLNIPILLVAYKNLGRGFVIKTLICTLSFSLFYSLLPSPPACWAASGPVGAAAWSSPAAPAAADWTSWDCV